MAPRRPGPREGGPSPRISTHGELWKHDHPEVHPGPPQPTGKPAPQPRMALVGIAVLFVLAFALIKLPVDQRAYAREAAERWGSLSGLDHRPAGSSKGGMVRLSEVPMEEVNHRGSGISKQVMVTNGQVPHLTGFSRSVMRPGQVVPFHSHATMDEVFYVQEGWGTFVVDGVAVRATPGTCIHVAAGQVHQITNDVGKGDLVMLYFGVAVD